MDFTSLLTPPLTSVLIPMLIRRGILLIAALLLDFVSFWETLIFWRSKKQHIVSRSSTEVEYRALADITSELLALRWLLEDMGLTHSSPTVIHCDNRSTIQIAHNDVSMSAPSILRLIVILCVIICSLASCTFFQLALLIKLLISLRRLFLLVVFAILFPNSRWLLSDHLEFEGGY